MELASFVLVLRPVPGSGWERLVGGWWGQAVHQAVVDLLLDTRAQVVGLSEAYHLSLHPEEKSKKKSPPDENGKKKSPRRPFTVSNLEVVAERFELRITALNSDCCRHFEYLIKHILLPGAIMRFDYMPLLIERLALTPLEHPLAMRTSYPILYQSFLDPASEACHIEFQLASPVFFSRLNSRADLPLPLPELVFGGLADKWNEMIGQVVFPPQEVRDLAYAGVAVSEFKLQSTMTPKKNGVIKGAIGRVHYELLTKDQRSRHIFATLAQYAFYAGVGKDTTKGMGQVRLV